jgi:hypothetical protein
MAYSLGPCTVDEVDFIFTARVSVLVAVASGSLDLNQLAKEELAERGYDQEGLWVGFERARDLLNSAQRCRPLSD